MIFLLFAFPGTSLVQSLCAILFVFILNSNFLGGVGGQVLKLLSHFLSWPPGASVARTTPRKSSPTTG